MHQRDTLYINGNWIAPSGQGKIEVIEASTEQVNGSIPEGEADAPNRLGQGDDRRPTVFGPVAQSGSHKQAGNGPERGCHRLDAFHAYQSLQGLPARSAQPASSFST
jgi:hypothetical protein